MISRKAKFFVIMVVFPRSYNLPFCRNNAPLRLSNEPTVYFIHRLRRFNVPMRLFNVLLG